MTRKLLFPFFIWSFLLLSCSPNKEVISPEIKSITESVYASGIIKSKNQYEVFSPSNGILKKVLVNEGMAIKKGAPLFELDNKDSKIATENARIAAATADFSVNRDKLEEAQNNIERARKNLFNDSILYVRQKNLWDKSIGSKVEFEKRELNYQNAKLALTNANIRYDELKRQLKLASTQSKNNLQLAKLREEDLIIRSEVDGVVYKINKEQGELVNSLSPIAVIGADEFMIELTIDEYDIVKIKPGQQVILRMDSYKSQLFEASIISIDPMMNTRTRSFTAEAVFTKKPPALFPNLTAEANIIIRTQQHTLTIPRNYLLNDSTVILQGGTPKKVETGVMDYDLVEIKGGIDQNTRIELPEK